MAIQSINPSEMEAMFERFKGNEEQVKNAQDLFNAQDMAKLIQIYTQENIKDSLKNEEPYKSMWAIFGKSPVLTFLTEEDAEDYDSLFRIAKLNYLSSVPSHKFKVEDIQKINMLRIFFKLSIKRSIGFDKNKINERTLQSTSINQIVRSNTEAFDSPVKQGVFGKIKSML